MKLSESYITQLRNLAGIILENRINKLYAEKYPQDIIDFTLNFAKETTRDNSSEENVEKNQYIPWIASQVKSHPDIVNKKDELNVIINWIKKSGYNKINSTESFESVYEKAKQWLTSKNINLNTGERVEGGKVVKKYPNGYQWIQATEVNWCINAGDNNGWCFNKQNRAEEFVGLGDINAYNRGYFLLDDNHNPLIALQYDSRGKWVSDVQGTFNNPLTPELIPYAFDIFKMLPSITDIKGHQSSFWKSFDYPGGEILKKELLKIPSVSLETNVKLHRNLPLSKEELDGLPIDRKLIFKIPLTQKEISRLGIDDKINFGYATEAELKALPISKKEEHSIPFTEDDYAILNQSIETRLYTVSQEGKNPKDLFIEKDFEGFKAFELDNDALRIDIEEDEYEKKYSGLDEYNRYFQHYDGSNEEVDESELDYMNLYLDKDNIEKLNDLSILLGVNNKYDFDEPEQIKEFLEDNIENYQEIFDDYTTNLGYAIGDAKEKAIEKELTSSQKFKYEGGYLVLPWSELYELVKSKNILTFKDLENSEINGEINLSEIAYDYIDELDKKHIKDLNKYVGKDLDKAIDYIHEHPEYSEYLNEFHQLISGLKFEGGDFAIYAPSTKTNTKTHKGNAIYKLELFKKTIFIESVNYAERKVSIFIIEYKDKAKKNFKRMLKGNVPFEKIADYVQQYSLFENEIRKIVRTIITEDFRYLYDTNTFTPTREVIQTAQKALQVVQNNKLVQSDNSNEGSGLRKANSLVAAEPMTHAQLKRMKAFFDNNFQAVQNEKNAGKNINTSPLIQKWELWGGDAGKTWAEKEIGSTQSSNQTSKKVRNSDMIARDNRIMNPNNTRIRK